MITSFDFSSGKWLSGAIDRLPGHDLYFGTPLNRPTAGIPIGDGDTGSLIWQERDGIHINIGKSDLWKDAAPGTTPDDECFNSSVEEEQTVQKHGGELILRFRHPAFDYMYQKEYETRLSLSDATAEINAVTPIGEVHARAFASSDAHVSVLHCRMRTEEADAPEIRLLRWGSRTLWRWYAQQLPHPEIGLDGTDASVADDRIYITQDLGTTRFCLGLAMISSHPAAMAVRQNRHEGSIALPPSEEHDITLYYCIRIADTTEQAKAACAEALDAAISIGEDKLYEDHRASWESFWGRSFIALSDDYLENNYYLYLYYMYSANRGAYPLRFMHGPWGFYHDFEPWAYYFHYNMQQVFAPLETAGCGDLAMNYYDMRRNSLDTACLFAERLKKRPGAFFHDVTDRYGRGAGYDSNNHTPGSQMAMEMWRHYRYIGDEKFLETHARPMLLACAEYYLAMLVREDDGLYHTHDTCGYEGNHLMDDTITDLAMMRVLFRTCLPLAPEEMRARLEDAIAHLTDYVTEPMRIGYDWDGEKILNGLGRGRAPVGEGHVITVGREENGYRRRKHGPDRMPEGHCLFPFVEFAPLYPSGDLGLADRGTPLFDAMTNQLNLSSFPSDPGDSAGMQWRMTPIFLARMGMADDVYRFCRSMMDIFQAYPNGFNAEQEEPACKPPYQCPQWYRPVNTDNHKRYKLCPDDFTHFDFETVPVVAKALQEALLQSYDGILRIAPAAPADQSAAFSLYAEGGFRVTAEIKVEENASSDYVITVESLRGEDGLLSLPAHMSAPYLYCRLPDGSVRPCPADTVSVGIDVCYRLHGDAGTMWIFSSCPAESLIAAVPQKAKKNMQMKECGKAHLGSPALMLREDGYYSEE